MLFTAKRVAQSTGEAAERLSSKLSLNHDRPFRNHGVKFESESLTPLQRAQLTAKQVAQSTGEAVERLGSKLDDVKRSQPEMKLQSRRHQDSTPKRHIVPDPHRHEPVHVQQTDISISPLQKVEITAQRVAKSTSKSLEKLNISQDATYTDFKPPHKQNEYLQGSKALPTSGTKENNHSRLPLTNCIHIHSSGLVSNVPNNKLETELSESEYSGKSLSIESKCGHCNPENVEYQEGNSISSFEKVKHTAKMVAESTGEAVQKLSSSLSDDI